MHSVYEFSQKPAKSCIYRTHSHVYSLCFQWRVRECSAILTSSLHYCCLPSYQKHCEQLIRFPSPQSLLHFSFMSLTPFQLISRKKNLPHSFFFPATVTVQFSPSLSSFLLSLDSCNLPRPLTPAFNTLSASKCPFVFCLVALTHIMLDNLSKVCPIIQFLTLIHESNKEKTLLLTAGSKCSNSVKPF